MRWSLVFLAACGGGAGFPDAHFGDDFPPPFFPDAEKIDATVCTMVCGGVCTDTDTDPHHCGACTNDCPTDKPSCTGGVCYQPQATQWVTHWGGDAADNTTAAMATDPSGNIYIAGAMTGTVDLGASHLISAGATDILVASFTPSGMPRWAKRFGGTGSDQGAGIAVEFSQVYVVATFAGTVDFGTASQTSAGGTDIALIILDANSGDALASHRYGTAFDDAGTGIAIDTSGFLAFSGSFGQAALDVGGAVLSGGGIRTGFAASVDVSFATRWARSFGATSRASDASACTGVATDSLGNVFVVGSFTGTTDFNGSAPAVTATGSDAFAASIDMFGNPRWVRTFGGPQDDSADAIAIDGGGNVAIGGAYHGDVDFGTGTIPSTGATDGFVVGYTSSGAFRFARHLGAATRSRVTGLAASGIGRVIATGQLEGAVDLGTGALAPLGAADAFVAELSAGTVNFARRYGGADVDGGAAVAVAPSGLVSIGGRFRGTADLGTGAIPGGAQDNGFVMTIAP